MKGQENRTTQIGRRGLKLGMGTHRAIWGFGEHLRHLLRYECVRKDRRRHSKEARRQAGVASDICPEPAAPLHYILAPSYVGALQLQGTPALHSELELFAETLLLPLHHHLCVHCLGLTVFRFLSLSLCTHAF